MSGQDMPARQPWVSNTRVARDVVVERVKASKGKISAKRLLPVARAAGYERSDLNFRRLVADVKRDFRRERARSSGRRPAVWSPGEHLVIDWGTEFGLHVFCAVTPWSRFRFVRFAADETATTTLRMLAEGGFQRTSQLWLTSTRTFDSPNSTQMAWRFVHQHRSEGPVPSLPPWRLDFGTPRCEQIRRHPLPSERARPLASADFERGIRGWIVHCFRARFLVRGEVQAGLRIPGDTFALAH